MIKLLIHWVLSAAVLLIIARIVPGFQVQGLEPALIAALVIGLLNGTLGLLLKIITFPITILTLGLFLLVINALLLKLASLFTPGFKVHGFLNAVVGSLVLTILSSILRRLVI